MDELSIGWSSEYFSLTEELADAHAHLLIWNAYLLYPLRPAGQELPTAKLYKVRVLVQACHHSN